MLDFDWLSHKRLLAQELDRLLPADSFAARMWTAIGDETHCRFTVYRGLDEEYDLFARSHPVEALFLWLTNDGYFDLERLADHHGDYLDEHGVRLPNGVAAVITDAEHLAAYGLWLATVHVDSKGPTVNDGWNKGGWSTEQLVQHQSACITLGYQALAYAQRLSSGQSARPYEIEKAKSLHFSNIGRKGSDALHGRHREQKQRVHEMWNSGKYPNKMACARAAKKERLITVAEQTARDWLQGVPDPDPWPAKPKK